MPSVPRLTRGGLTRRTVLASGLLAILIGGVFTVLVLTNYEQRDARRLSRHSRAERAEAERLLQVIVDAETGMRGFVITRAERFLKPWTDARRSFPRDAAALANFVDDPAQAGLARRMAKDGTSYIEDYSVPIVDAVRRNDPSADSLATIDRGRRLVDTLRAEFGRFAATEGGAVTAQQTRVDDAAGRGLAVATGGLGLSIALIALFGGFLVRGVVLPVRRAAGMAGRLAGGDLAVRMPETGTAEIGELQRAFNTMGSSLGASQDELRRLADEQAALRRVATLVARAVPAVEIWAAVVAEMQQLLNPDSTALLRYEADGTATMLAAQGRDGMEVPVAEREALQREGVGAPIVVEGAIWGVIVAAWREQEPPPETEARIAEFTELVATAIANAESRDELTASRARVVATADETRRRIERDLHDGAQQRLVHTIILLKLARRALGANGDAGPEVLDEALDHAERANTQLRELVHGVMPTILRRGGLRAGVGTLTSRAPLPVSADVTAERFPAALEATAYFIVAEALTNVLKHAAATNVHIGAAVDGDTLRLEIRDDGVGGAQLDGGHGLLGLQDRAAAVNGVLRVESPPDGGTVVTAELPVTGAEA